MMEDKAPGNSNIDNSQRVAKQFTGENNISNISRQEVASNISSQVPNNNISTGARNVTNSNIKTPVNNNQQNKVNPNRKA